MSNVYYRKKHQSTDTKSEEKSLTIGSSSNTVVKNVKEVNVLLGLIIFRLCNVVLVQTWFVPDEYWQGPEVAHKIVFGYGHETWEWKEGIRGYTFPLIFAVFFKCLQFFRADWTLLVVYLPRLLQAILSAVGEFYIYKFAKLICSPGAAWWVLFSHITSWFLFFCSTRVLTNTMETSFVSIGLYYWQLANFSEFEKKFSLYKALTFASFSCLVRPTALIVWIPLGVSKVLTTKSLFNFVFKHVLPIGLAALLFSIGIDSLFYGKFVLVQYNFLYFNIMQNIGELYGMHPWHWYLSQGIPVVLTSHLVPLVFGVCYSGKSLSKWVLLIVINIFIYSCLSHKEFRFILPIIPLLMCICGEGLHKVGNSSTLDYSNKKYEDSKKAGPRQITLKGKILAVFLIVTNTPIAMYTGLLHQRGTLDVMKALGDQLQSPHIQNFSVLFLMPCHSTPYYSYIHRNIEMKFLDCSPSANVGYVDEADQFYNNPVEWLNKRYKNQQNTFSLPTHAVFFDVLLNNINDFLHEHNYVKCGEFFYSHFPSGRIGKQVLLFCKIDLNHKYK